MVAFTQPTGENPLNRRLSREFAFNDTIFSTLHQLAAAGNLGKGPVAKYLQHTLSEEKKEKSEEKRCPFGTTF